MPILKFMTIAGNNNILLVYVNTAYKSQQIPNFLFNRL